MTTSLDGLATLDGVRAFLADQVAPLVPAELMGELRAAMKLLDTVQTELNERHAVLGKELDDLFAYCFRIAQLLERDPLIQECRTLTRRAGASRSDLRSQGVVWRDARALSSTLLVELLQYRDDPGTPDDARAAAVELAAEFCACLGDHARARVTWQAVFPMPAAVGIPEEPTHD